MKVGLASIWSCAVKQVSFPELIRKQGIEALISPESAYLFWGKAAREASQALDLEGPRLVISPENGDHPLPGSKSFQNGSRVLEFFDYLGRRKVRHLSVFLSGGASSLAWIKPAGLSTPGLQASLADLYHRPMTIQELNHRRAELCALKKRGCARWLRALAPELRARVFAISDVAPFGVETLGSGPFIQAGDRSAARRVPHRVLADNSALVQAAERLLIGESGESLIESRHSLLGHESWWARTLVAKIRGYLREGRDGILIWGGEPQVNLIRHPGRGGRLSQMAARLALELWEEIRCGRVEVLLGSSDGNDGCSGAAAVHLRPWRGMKPMSVSLQRQLKKAIAAYNTAPFLGRNGFLIPSFSSGSNVQDLVLVRISSSAGKLIAS